ncbi:MAG TPA: metalloregulator ArsR/SmtB family transcription factor [Ktedonobacteraceae bacterium]|jgi:ArsR family transcriptional regulator|nr:metalloregulator ArsR/SmtB family transcription factor [Ktedonobacteraceae bacterium]
MDDWRELKLMVKALGGVARLTIVYLLAREDGVTVTALTAMLGLSQPLVSWHLRKLRRAGLVHTRREGRQVYCSLDKDRYQYCLQRLNTLIDPAVQLEAFPVGEMLIEAEVALED